MLILTRRIGENAKVFKDDNLKKLEMQFTVLGIKGNQVRIGFDAEKTYTILRDEIYRKTAKDKNLEEIKDPLTKKDILKRNKIFANVRKGKANKEQEEDNWQEA